MPGEFDFIDWIRLQQKTNDLVQLAAGDDLAILKWHPDDLLLVGTDQVLDGVHFNSDVHPPRDIGRKAMNRNLSDCAAMACLPAAALVSIALPKTRDIEYAKELYLGIKKAAIKFDCPIVGGDTGSWGGKLAVSVSIIGRSAGIKPLTRKGARAGDSIYVSGDLGGSILGRHMDFEPKVQAARVLAGTGLITAMTDISDGLSRDLRHICEESGVGALIHADSVPVHADAVEMRRDGRSPLEHAMYDGEDYELLFTGADLASVIRNITKEPGAIVGIFQIGTITAEQEIILEQNGARARVDPQGWEHQF